MLRSIVARSQSLLYHLRRTAAAPGSAILPSCAYASTSTPVARCNGLADGVAPAARHLYMVLEEEAMNRFSIYKLPGVEDRDAVTNDEAPRRLPRGALHLSYSLIGSTPQFEALRSKIAIYGYSNVIFPIPNNSLFMTMVYDTKTGTLDAWTTLPDMPDPHLHDDEVWIKDGYNAAATVSDRICVLEAVRNTPFYLYEKHNSYYLDEWTWQHGPSPLPLHATDDDNPIKSHAVHPDGHTIFASSSFTFSLDTKTGESADRGKWLLPFHGRGYYDSDLGTWVGIRVADGKEGGSIKGYSYMCACHVPTALAHHGSQCGRNATMLPEPAWNMCKEELTFVNAPTTAMSRTLVHTGCGKFCLIEVSQGGEARVTMFCAKRATNGELKVTPYQPGRSYLVPNYSRGLLTAFWM